MKRDLGFSSTAPVSFVDLFACGLGAVLLFWLMFLASTPSTQSLPGTGNVVRIQVVKDLDAEVAMPLIGVLCEVGGEDFHPHYPPPSGSQSVKYLIHNPGSAEYLMQFTTKDFQPEDRLSVYLYDLLQRDRATTVKVFWEVRTADARGPKSGEITLSASQPMLEVRLGQLLEPLESHPKWNPVE